MSEGTRVEPLSAFVRRVWGHNDDRAYAVTKIAQQESRIHQLEGALNRIAASEHHIDCAWTPGVEADCSCFPKIARAALRTDHQGGTGA